jgi:hypothetical protein
MILVTAGTTVVSSVGAEPPVLVPPAAEFHKLISSTADTEVVAVALGAGESAAWVESTPAELRRKNFLLEEPTRVAVKAVRFDGRAITEATAWERSAKLLQLVPGKTTAARGVVSLAYLDYDSPIAAVPVSVASGANGWKIAAKPAGAGPQKAVLKKRAGGFLLAEAATGNLRRTYHLVCEPGADPKVKQLAAVADVELGIGAAKFTAPVRIPITADAGTVAAFEKSLGEDTPMVEFQRTESAFCLLWTGAGPRALVIGIPRLERAVLAALLTDVQDRVRVLGEPSPDHQLRDLEPLLQRAEIANALAQVPAVKGAFTGDDAPAPGRVRDALARVSDAYGGIVLRNTVTVGGAKWVVYYDVRHRKARVLPESVGWTVTADDPAVEVARPDKVSVFFLEARGVTTPAGADRDQQFQKALAAAVGVPDLPPVTFAYGPVGLPRGAVEGTDDNVSSLKIDWADTRVGERLTLRLTVERQERDYLRTVLLEKTGLPLRLGWDGKAFALDRLKDGVVLPGRVILDPKAKVPVRIPEANKLEVLVFAGPGLWAGRDGDKTEVTVKYQSQSETLTLRKGSRDPAQATFELVTDDNGRKPVLRLQYRTRPAGPWVDAEAPVVVIP